jgi:ribose transport system permease protein
MAHESAGGVTVQEPPTPPGAPARPARRGFGLDRYGTLLFFLLFYVVISATQGTAFLSWSNISLTLGQNAHLAFLAAAVTVTLIAGQFDLSVGYLCGMSAVLMAHLTSVRGLGTLEAALIVLVVGVVAGLINGTLVTRFKVNAFIATLGTGGAYGGISLWISGGQTIFGNMPALLTQAGTAKFATIPLPVFYAIVLVVVMWAVTRQTSAGRFWYAVGANPESARLAGVRTDRMTMWAFVTTSVLASTGGMIFVARYGSADPSTGPDLLLPAFAAAFLGSSILSDGRFTMIGSILATFLIVLATNGLDVAGVNFAVKPVFNGLVLVAAVALTEYLRRRRPRRRPAVAAARDAR